jgi:hypothetical protein
MPPQVSEKRPLRAHSKPGQQESKINHLNYLCSIALLSFLDSFSFSQHAWRNNTMMRKQLAIPALAFALATSGLAMAQPYAAPAPAFQDHDRDRDWDTPPQEFRDIQRQGYHDGVEGARKDYDNHRRPDVKNRDEYRHPHVPDSAKADYREGFRRGYETAWDHLMHSGSQR